ncbi:MAG: hypothetical protein JF616_06015 [Fibrobacteres bacterium]|jgi:hypothetical protein|nr:hypothetical protein [Fibrobacterota bacterium]
MRPRLDRFIPVVVAALGMGVLLTGCDSSPNGSDGGTQDGTYMTALIDGKPWYAEMGASFSVRPPGDTGSDESLPPGIIGVDLNNNSFSFAIPTDQPDSVPLDSIPGKHIGEFTKDGYFFFTRSGYVKFTRVSGTQVEGIFACEMVAIPEYEDSLKVIQVTNGKFLAKAVVVPSAKIPSP